MAADFALSDRKQSWPVVAFLQTNSAFAGSINWSHVIKFPSDITNLGIKFMQSLEAAA